MPGFTPKNVSISAGMAASIRLTIGLSAVRAVDDRLDLGGDHDIGGQRDASAIGPEAQPHKERQECESAYCSR